MPKLPGEESFGARPNTRADSRVFSYRAGIAESAEAKGHLANAAAIGDASKTLNDFTEGVEKQNLAKARSDFATAKIELDARFAKDLDFETADERYSAELQKLYATHGGNLSGRSRSFFDAATRPEMARGVAANQAVAFGRRKDHNLAELAGILKANHESFLTERDSLSRKGILESTQTAIDAMVAQGFMDETQAVKMGQEFVMNAAVSRVAMQPAEEIHRLLQIPEGWGPGDKLPDYEPNGSVVDYIPEDKRVALARKAMPGVNAKVAISETARIQDAGGTIEEQIERAKKISNPTVQDDVLQRLKADYAFAEQRRKQSVLKNAQTQADLITGSGLTFAAARTAARDIEDPDERKAATALINDHFSAIETQRKMDLRVKKEEAVTLAREGKYPEIDPGVLAELGGNMASALQGISERANRGAQVYSKPAIYNELNRMTPEEIEAVDLMDPKYLGGLSETDWRSFSNRQARIISEKDPADKTAQRTRSQIVTQELKGAKITSNEDIALFNRKLDERIEALELTLPKGQKATPDQIRKITDELLLEGEIKGGEYNPFDPDRRRFEVKEGETFFLDEVSDIPAAHLARFRTKMKEKSGKDPTDAEVLEMYNKYLNR